MEEYKLTLGIEPTDYYKKAKQDLIQAMWLFNNYCFNSSNCCPKSHFEQQMS